MNLRIFEKEKVVFLDGAMGTMLQRAGLKAGEVPESYNILHPEIIEDIHRKYIEAGSDIVTTNTFGANEYKLKHSVYNVEEVVKSAVSIARSAAGSEKLVALDIGPTGQLLEPMGDLSFEEAYDAFARQVKAGAEAGADLILIETMSDIYEARAAILAAKENCSLPVFCTMTFQENGRTLTGSDPLTMVNIIQNLGVDALGVNCSVGPKDMMSIVKQIISSSRVPVIVQPNAGLPKLRGGTTTYDVTPEEFGRHMKEIAEMGAAVLGGCCGTSPEYIRCAKEISGSITRVKVPVKPVTAVSSSRKTVVLGEDIKIVGERINPTGKEYLKRALLEGDLDYIVEEAQEQKSEGAHILDVNIGLPGIDEKTVMTEVVKELQSMVDLPLQIDSTSPQVIEAAVRLCNGRPMINSVNGSKKSLEAILPVARKYGACIIAMTLDEKGIPKTAEERVEIAERIINTAAKYGIPKENIIIDCLALAASANKTPSSDSTSNFWRGELMETIKAVRLVKERFGTAVCLGISNVSYKLPNRPALNRTFLAMALEAGLDTPILNPNDEGMHETIDAYKVIANLDTEGKEFITKYR